MADSGIRRTIIDGVQVFWGEAPGELYGRLTFRVGHADETLLTAGTTHLIEHLALFNLPRTLRHNGTTEPILTRFHAVGSPDDVVTVLNSCVRALVDLPFDRMPTEIDVLRTEHERQPGSNAALAQYLRYGPSSFGLLNSPQLGLWTATPDTLRAWSERFFNRSNAVLFLNGPVPPGLDFSPLPDGDRQEAPVGQPLDQYVPAWEPRGDRFFLTSMIGTRSPSLLAGISLVGQRLHRRLRDDTGLSYEVGSFYDPTSNSSVHCGYYADSRADSTQRTLDAFHDEQHSLRLEAPSEQELSDLHEEQRKSWDIPGASAGAAAYLADEWSTKGELGCALDEYFVYSESQMGTVTPTSVQAALRESVRTSIVLVPNGVAVDQRFERIAGWSDWKASGSVFPASGEQRSGLKAIHLSTEGISLEYGNGVVSAKWAEVMSLQKWADGGRVLMERTGFRLSIDPAAIHGSRQAIDYIDRVVPQSVHVEMDHNAA